MRNMLDIRRDFNRPFTSVVRDFDRPFLSWRPLLRQVEEFFNEVASGIQLTGDNRSGVPVYDVKETDDHYILSFDMPGLEKDNIDVEVRDKQLMVSGERKLVKEGELGRTQVSERRYRKFEQVLTLPHDVKTDNIEAEYYQGVLSLVVPKAPEAKPHRIPIKEGTGDQQTRRLSDSYRMENSAGISASADIDASIDTAAAS